MASVADTTRARVWCGKRYTRPRLLPSTNTRRLSCESRSLRRAPAACQVHVGPGKTQWPSAGKPAAGGGEGGGASTANLWKQADSFTTMHPGLFAGGGGTGTANAARFDYWRYTDHEVFAS